LPTWMVVEDEPDIYDVLLAMFEIWGIEGVAFVDGTEAVQWIDEVDRGMHSDELPELAILDIRLPTIQGPEVGARLRKSSRLGNIAIVMITAYRLSPDDERKVIAQAQADTLLYKPLPVMPELHKLLDGIIAKRKLMKPVESAAPSGDAAKLGNSKATAPTKPPTSPSSSKPNTKPVQRS
jgi:CheY-like chemotaxis protein